MELPSLTGCFCRGRLIVAEEIAVGTPETCYSRKQDASRLSRVTRSASSQPASQR